jgi:hypothetical protein
MWHTENIPLNEKTYIWIKSKSNSTKNSQIIIEIKNKQILIHYLLNEYIIDTDSPKDK